MFSSNDLLRRKTPQEGIGRKEYINHLVDEFHTTTNVEAQEQISANLANFAYDPINFGYLCESSAVDLFFQLLILPNEKLILHGIAGLNNICLDPTSRIKITETDNLKLISEILQSTENIEVAINILTLYHILLSEDLNLRKEICIARNLQRIHHFKNSSEKRLKGLAAVFLDDFGTRTIELKNDVQTIC